MNTFILTLLINTYCIAVVQPKLKVKNKLKKSVYTTLTLRGAFRSLYDPLPHPLGSGGDPTATPGVCHRPAPAEGQCRGLEVHQPLPHRHRWVDQHNNRGQKIPENQIKDIGWNITVPFAFVSVVYQVSHQG